METIPWMAPYNVHRSSSPLQRQAFPFSYLPAITLLVIALQPQQSSIKLSKIKVFNAISRFNVTVDGGHVHLYHDWPAVAQKRVCSRARESNGSQACPCRVSLMSGMSSKRMSQFVRFRIRHLQTHPTILWVFHPVLSKASREMTNHSLTKPGANPRGKRMNLRLT